MKFELFRSVPAHLVKPGETVDLGDGDDVLLRVDEVQRRMGDEVRLGGLRPGHKRREYFSYKAGDKVRVVPTAEQVEAVWNRLREAASRASENWADAEAEAEGMGSMRPSLTPWETEADDTITIEADSLSFSLQPVQLIDAEPGPVALPVDESF